MPRVFRQQYTRAIPDTSQRVTVKNKKGKSVPAVRFKDADGRSVTAPLTKAGDRCRVASPLWYGQYTDADGVVQRIPLCENKTAAEQMLGELVRKAEMGRAGVRDPFEDQRRRPLAEHLADFCRELAARDNSPRYVELVASRLTALVEGCGFVFTADLSASKAMDWLATLRRSDPSRHPLDPRKEEYTRSEAAAALGISTTGFRLAVKRLRLAAHGKGKARRYPRGTVEAIRDDAAQGVSVQTTNYYISHLKSFCRWMVKDRRTGDNPVAHLEAGNAGLDRRHDRRELTADELRLLLAAARASVRAVRGLTGEDRFHLYAAACGTGFRASALASLTPAAFDLDAATPTVTLRARSNKSRRTKVQPLPADVAALLRDYLRDRPADSRPWAGTGTGSWARDGKGAEMLRIDLEAAGIPYVVEGPDGPLFADFHALRHSYLTLGGRAGIDLRTLQELAGHSSPALTARYSHRRLHDLAGAVEKLPNFLPPSQPAEAVRATGTDAGRERAYTALTQIPDSGRESLIATDDGDKDEPPARRRRKSANRGELIAPDGECERLREDAASGLATISAAFTSAASPYSLRKKSEKPRGAWPASVRDFALRR